MNLAVGLLLQSAVLIIGIVLISQFIGKYLIHDYQEDFEE